MVKSMANVKWTEEQQQAINEKGANILVAAAAVVVNCRTCRKNYKTKL